MGDLSDLTILLDRVRTSRNLVLLLTKSVLSRPWVLVEIATAVETQVPVLLVEVLKKGNEFAFPDDAFFEKLHAGKIVSANGMDVLEACNVSLERIDEALR